MKRISIFIVSIFLIFTLGCIGAMKREPVESGFNKGFEMTDDKDLGKVYLAPGFNFKGYDVLLVLDPSTEMVLQKKNIDPEEMKIYFKNQLIKMLRETGVYKTVTDDSSVLSSMQDTGCGALVMKTVFTELDPGNRALRYLIPGAGATKVQVESEIKDSKTEKIYFKASNRMSAIMGTFGGDSKAFILDSLYKIAEAHAAFIKRISSGDETKE
jgi:hypothetical protein